MNLNNYIVFQLTQSDNIRYQLSSNEEDILYSKYKDFFKELVKYPIFGYMKLIEEVSTFKTIILFTETGKWEILQPEKREYSKEELMEYNHIETKQMVEEKSDNISGIKQFQNQIKEKYLNNVKTFKLNFKTEKWKIRK